MPTETQPGAGETPTAIAVDAVGHHYVRPDTGETHHSLDRIDLTVPRGEFFCLLGPSGCGKSTLLNLIAGFEPVTAGSITAEGDVVSGPSASRGVAFQSDAALFPWLTVYENVTYGPRMRKLPRAQYRSRTHEALELVNLWEHRDKFPRELSGGMRQRCQIARLVTSDPATMLMDEPFGSLDAQTRRYLQREFVEIWMQNRKTVVFVTHDVTEAVLLGDRVGVMTRGPAARMKTIVPVDLPRPRDSSSPEFRRMVDSLTSDLEMTGSGGDDDE